MIYTGTLEDLKKLLALESAGADYEENTNNKVILRLPNRAVMSWYKSTGTLQFQGPRDVAKQLEDFVSKRLENPESPLPSIIERIESGIDINSNPTTENKSQEYNFMFNGFNNAELFIGIVSPVGTPLTEISDHIKSNIESYGYKFIEIRLSQALSSISIDGHYDGSTEFKRISKLMKGGDLFRERSEHNDILAMHAVAKIKEEREKSANKGAKLAFFVNSLKHPSEVFFLRKIYGQSFYLIGVHADKKRRMEYLLSAKNCTNAEAEKLITIDEDEDISFGQKTRDSFHLADFFINIANNRDLEKAYIARFFEIIFANPYKTPTFDEFAMFMAFSSSVRSADLSRQVGAVLARDNQIIATGVNDCPQFGGGQYWAHVESNKIIDTPDGKDYTRGVDANKQEQQKIIDKILHDLREKSYISEELKDPVTQILGESGIRDLIEFGRVVHAEMETLLSCARAGINTNGTTLYCTTFPCHNCAKHIIDAGVKRVVYVEPYPKSKALELHNDSITLLEESKTDVSKVLFEAFQGIAARRFWDLFSMNLGTGNKLKRKNSSGYVVEWSKEQAQLRVPRLLSMYEKLEECIRTEYLRIQEGMAK